MGRPNLNPDLSVRERNRIAKAKYYRTKKGQKVRKSYIVGYRKAGGFSTSSAKWYVGKGKEHYELVKNTPEYKFKNYKHSAKTRGKPFELTLEQFKKFWQVPCSYCGDAIETIGLDRVDSSKGYIEGNVVSCCKACNYAKLERDAISYGEHCLKVAKHMGLVSND